MSSRIRVGLDEVLQQFEELEDPRSDVKLRHPLVSVVVIAIMAVLAGTGGPTAIAKWAVMKEELLLRLLPLPHGIPSKDVSRRVLATLRLVDIQGAIITIDAMGTQTAIAKQIIESDADDVPALKGNQGTLHQAVIDDVDEQLAHNFSGIGARRHITKEKGHGREETRHYVQMPVPKNLPGLGRWKGLLSIGVAMLSCLRDGKETADIRYFISSLPVGVKRFARAVRGHWGIENSCHWSLDFTYREDESRIRDVHVRETFAWLNRFTHTLLKQHPDRESLVMKRRCCGWNDKFLTQVLTGETT